jgi:hypothetical protein
MWSVVGTVILGALGWAIAKLIFEPFKEIMDLRRQAQECLILHGYLAADAPPNERLECASEFRKIGAGLVSRHIAAYPWVRWCVHYLGWDIHSAGAMLIGISDSTRTEAFSNANLSATVALIRESLRLPPPEQAPMIRELLAHAARPAPLERGTLS